MNQEIKSYTLSNGNLIPKIGFGTWKAKAGGAVDAVLNCLKVGYRHIDTAAAYGNEVEVGKAINESGINRTEIFVTSKLQTKFRGYETTISEFEKTLKALDTAYLDLYLIHWPANAKMHQDWEQINNDTWRAFEKLFTSGKIKNIGVSNFLPHHLEALLKAAKLPPVINQIEFHPGYYQPDTLSFCQQNDILVEAWSPLGQGDVLRNKTLVTIAEKHNCSTAQLCLAWELAKGVAPLPKSVTPERIQENFDIFQIELSSSEMSEIDNLSEFGFSGLHPDEVEF